jgi:hypothetical protein
MRTIDFSQPLSKRDTEYVRQREWMIQDARLSGFTVQLHGEDPIEPEVAEDTDGETGETESEEGELTYEGLTVKQLQSEISARNADRDEDDQLSTKGTKDVLIEALVADDEANDEEPEGDEE